MAQTQTVRGDNPGLEVTTALRYLIRGSLIIHCHRLWVDTASQGRGFSGRKITNAL